MSNAIIALVQHPSGEWKESTFDFNDSGELMTIDGVDNFPSPNIFCTYDRATQTIYWLAIDKRQLYRLDYNKFITGVAKARQLGVLGAAGKYISIPQNLSKLGDFSETAYSNALRSCQESLRTPESLLNIDELNGVLIRPADDVVQEQLIANNQDDFILFKTQAFIKQCSEQYIKVVRDNLSALIAQNQNNYHGLKNELEVYLKNHFETFHYSFFSYTAIPTHPVTMLLVTIAERLGQINQKPAIEYLLPGVSIVSASNDFLDLGNISLSTILGTHILDKKGRCLFPVGLLLHHARLPDQENMSLMDVKGVMNPYYDPFSEAFSNNNEDNPAFISESDLARLYQHSQLTRNLSDVYTRYKIASNDESTLLGQLKQLISVLKTSDVEGTGAETDVDPRAYPALIAFMSYYRRLNPMSFYVTNAKPMLESLNAENQLGYALVRSGDDAGLYCINQYIGTLTQLCDADYRLRYPLDVCVLDTLNDTPEFRASLNQNHPTLLQVAGEPEGHYHIYGRNKEGVWAITSIEIQDRIRLPAENNRTNTLALGNVPDAIYKAIDVSGAHSDSQTLVDYLLAAYPNGTNDCSLEQLKTIETHTGHLDLDEFNNVPEDIRQHMSQLWNFIQNYGINFSATETTQTCVKEIREQLELAVSKHHLELNSIGWSRDEQHKNYNSCLNEFITARQLLSQSLETGLYEGADSLAPTPISLKAINKTLKIESEEDVVWFCSFPLESMNAFLSDADNHAISDYLKAQYSVDGKLAYLLLRIPARTYKLLLSVIDISFIDRDVLCALINFLDTEEKTTVLLDALQDQMHDIINSPDELGTLLDSLNKARYPLFLNAIRPYFLDFIQNTNQLSTIFEHLSSARREGLLNSLTDSLATIILNKNANLNLFVYGILSLNEFEFVFDFVQTNLCPKLESYDDLYHLILGFYWSGYDKNQKGILSAAEKRLGVVIQSYDELCGLTSSLNNDLRMFVLYAVKDHFCNIFDNKDKLRDALLLFEKDACKLILDGMKGSLSKLFQSYSDFHTIDIELASRGKDALLLEAMEEHIPSLITTSAELVRIKPILTERQYNELLFVIKERLPELIQNKNQLLEVCRILNDKQCQFLLSEMKTHFVTIVTDEVGLKEFRSFLNSKKYLLALNAIEECLPVISTQNTTQRKQEDLFSRVDQPNIQAYVKVDDMQHLLSTEHQNNQVIITPAQAGSYSIFSHPKVGDINNAVLKQQLQKYIKTREKEFSFHWDFLGVMVFLSYLLNEPFVRLKETQLAAANYALSAMDEPTNCLVKLVCLDKKPTKQQQMDYKNSYILVGKPAKSLYYIDYAGSMRKISVKDFQQLVGFFKENADKPLTYDEISTGMKEHICGKLPTDVQLKALKDGSLGDIMRDASQNILNGTVAVSGDDLTHIASTNQKNSSSF
jgi:hypothetical protein